MSKIHIEVAGIVVEAEAEEPLESVAAIAERIYASLTPAISTGVGFAQIERASAFDGVPGEEFKIGDR